VTDLSPSIAIDRPLLPTTGKRSIGAVRHRSKKTSLSIEKTFHHRSSSIEIFTVVLDTQPGSSRMQDIPVYLGPSETSRPVAGYKSGWERPFQRAALSDAGQHDRDVVMEHPLSEGPAVFERTPYRRHPILAVIAVTVLSNLAPGPRCLAGPQAEAPRNSPSSWHDAPSVMEPDERYKADILLVVAHPDDDLEVATYLAKASLDEHKRIAVLYTTRGNTGGNKIGFEQAGSLAAVREIEARRALALLDISLVWFLNAPDTPAPNGHDVLRSLENWNHGSTLGEVVRIIRLTRPAVVLTFLPDVVVGENHEDHQAAGVIATEAFDIAGDPTQFPEQVAFPDNHRAFGELLEGLRPWQPHKLYYFSDAEDNSFLKGRGPDYPIKEVSPSRHLMYFRFWLAMSGIYRTQFEDLPTADAPEPPGFNPPPLSFVLGKSLVGGTTMGDILENTGTQLVPYAPVRGYRPLAREGIAVELGGAWNFYAEFWRAHNLDHLAQLLPIPELGVSGGGKLPVPLLIRNDTNESQTVELQLALPKGWTGDSGITRYPIPAHSVYPVALVLTAPAPTISTWQKLLFNVESNGKAGTSTVLRVQIRGSR
jgi:LmbE family N-acetylglucosaminyl deacetylase